MRASIIWKGEDIMEDLQIIGLYLERNEKAITVTEQKYGKYCFCIANNILSNEQDSEECVNDTYSRVWNTIPPQKPNSLKLYLARITRNLALDRVKSKMREKRVGDNLTLALDEISEIVSDGENVEKYLEARELMQSVNAFLHTLSQRDCNVFVSRYFFLEEIEKIAKKYGLSSSNVSKILSRSRARLKEYLQKEGYSI